jgi:rare lipoprotein A
MRFVPVRVTVGGARPVVMFTNAATLSGLLEALGLKLHRLDQVRPKGILTLYLGEAVQVIRISRFRETVAQPVPFTTLIQYSSDLPQGVVRIVSPGRPGRIFITYWVTKRNGKVVVRDILSVRLASEPISQVEIHGTRPPAPNVQYGQASWYQCSGMHAAHLTLPFGTTVTVRDLDNGKSVTVVINDRGPYGVPGRIIDLCAPAFAVIAPLSQGVANVQISW